MTTRYLTAPIAPTDWTQQVPELHPVIARLVYNLGIHSVEAAEKFLHPEYERDQYDPFVFADMARVIDRIIAARNQNESVLVYGDYDADGVCSAVLLYSALQQIGVKQLQLYLPHRDTEGYGLNVKAVETFATQGVQLIITVDCAISNAAEVTLAKQRGMEVIVTDHHVEPLQLPTDAFAIVNPQVKQCHYPWPMLAGVGVAFKVAQALGRRLQLGEAYEKWMLDLVAISTITDCMPLLDENRTLVRYGLVVLNKTKRLGLQRLIAATHKPGTPVTTGSISYRIGPWINAAGRMDHANVAVKLLLAETEAEADKYVQQLAEANSERQKQTEAMFTATKQQADQQTDQPLLCVLGETWPVGLIGLVAGKLVSQYHKPAFVLTKHNGEIFGSGRSLPGVNLIKTLQSIEHIFSRYGGHAMACGFTLNVDTTPVQFAQAFIQTAHDSLAALDPVKELTIAAELSLDQVNWQFVEQLSWLEPFGERHPEPLFSLPNVQIKDFQTVGAMQKHLRLVLTDTSHKTLKAIAFGLGNRAEQLHLGDTVTVVGTVSVNQWNGNKELQFQVKDIL